LEAYEALITIFNKILETENIYYSNGSARKELEV